MVQDLLSVNWNLFEDINQPAGHEGLLDPVMVFAANDLIFLLPLLLIVLWFALARWSPLAPRGSAGDAARMEGHITLALAVVGVVIALGINVLLGHLLFEPRPFISHPTLVHKLIAHAPDASFPSDHSAAAFALATVLLVSARTIAQRDVARWLAAILALLGILAAVAIAFARVYVGVHYPGDVLAGAICGILGGLIALALRPLLTPLLTPLIRGLGQIGLA
ncbi:MAG TPA: phosphatase PAP2 family protein [Ktedonobacterales bacterium]|nr:phosphatase PAP2 family protein [Ktedonobacterales bacterium]